LFCKKAEFLHIPLEQGRVPKETRACNQSITSHFQTKPVLSFQFAPENTASVRQFLANLDTYAQDYDLEESQDFLTYPPNHDHHHETILKLGDLCSCDPHQARNQYLNN
jgi:hypothetical protein